MRFTDLTYPSSMNLRAKIFFVRLKWKRDIWDWNKVLNSLNRLEHSSWISGRIKKRIFETTQKNVIRSSWVSHTIRKNKPPKHHIAQIHNTNTNTTTAYSRVKTPSLAWWYQYIFFAFDNVLQLFKRFSSFGTSRKNVQVPRTTSCTKFRQFQWSLMWK